MDEQKHTSYAQSKGLRLLELAVNDLGPLFTIQQLEPVALTLQLSPSHLRNLLSTLASSGWIEIIKRGVYAVRSPLYAGEVPPFVIAAALVQPSAISHWSACAHHGFTSQIPAIVQASTPKNIVTPEMRGGAAHSPRGRAVWQAAGLEFEFIHVGAKQFWGFERIWANAWQQVDITDPERTALDLFIRPEIFGGLSAAMEILEDALSSIQIPRLVEYARKHDTGSVIKRLGWALESLRVPVQTLSPLLDYPVKRFYPLEPRLSPTGQANPRWKVIDNLKR